MSSYNINELNKMNYNSIYGSNWIKYDINTLNSNNRYTLYPTGDASINSGRIYIALPTTTKLTNIDKIKYNIIN